MNDRRIGGRGLEQSHTVRPALRRSAATTPQTKTWHHVKARSSELGIKVNLQWLAEELIADFFGRGGKCFLAVRHHAE
jgi:very-short-patch-repair endonuclease